MLAQQNNFESSILFKSEIRRGSHWLGPSKGKEAEWILPVQTTEINSIMEQ